MLKLKMMLCVMMLPWSSDQLHIKTIIGQCIEATASGVDNAASGDFAEQLISPSES